MSNLLYSISSERPLCEVQEFLLNSLTAVVLASAQILGKSTGLRVSRSEF